MNCMEDLLFCIYFTSQNNKRWYNFSVPVVKGVTKVFRNLTGSNLLELNVEYSIPLAHLSFLLICVASYTALEMNNRTQNYSIFHRNIWIMLGAIAMGFGIWSMHFVGAFAISLPIAVHYDRFLTTVSIVPAIVSSFLAFYIANRQRRSLVSLINVAVIIGLGNITMFYVGIRAMKTEAYFKLDLGIFLLALAVAFLFSILASWIYHSFKRNRFIQLLTAIALSLAVFGMHCIGMISMKFYIPKHFYPTSTTFQMVDMNLLATYITIGMIILLGTLIISTFLDKYIEHRAIHYDLLTRLPNRRLFELELKKPKFPMILAIWHLHDLDQVNRENDYQFGDEVIQYVASILKSITPPRTVLYRIEGHRFAFLSHDLVDMENLQVAMEKVSEILSKHLVVHEKEVYLQAVCTVSKAYNYEELSNIYINALAVLNHRSTQFHHEIIHYDPKIHTYIFDREISEGVPRAIKEKEFYLVYQPKVSGKTNEIIGVETLLRWEHPTHGFISPAVFIPILEEYDRMVIVTDWIIDQVCMQMWNWRKEGIPFQNVAINIPGQYVTSSRLLEKLKRAVAEYNLEPEQLELEITETSFVKNIKEAMRAVSVFRQEGFSVALDDFGTGVSSLSYLKQIPISTLKIDKSFIDEIPHSKKDSSIIQAIIGLGESLDLTIVFEGVELKEQVEFIASTCKNPVIQGYYFAKPMKVDELWEWYHSLKQESVLS